MGNPLRHQKKDAIYFITNTTLHRKFFFRPGERVNEIILGLLAKTAEKYDVEIFSFVFMSNHFHLLARSRALMLHLFMRDLQSQLARQLNAHWRRSGKFFERRYSSSEVLGDDALLDKLRYTICNPCLSNLVSHPKMWPGLSSWTIHKEQTPLVGRIVNREVYWSLKRKKGNEHLSEEDLIELATEEYTLAMTKLPKFKELDDDAYHQKICKLVEEHALEIAKKRTVPCLGRAKILAQRFDSRPSQPKKSPRPICHTNCATTKKEHLKAYWEVCDRYKAAIGKLRKNKTNISFPEGTIPPGHLYAVGGGPAEGSAAASGS